MNHGLFVRAKTVKLVQENIKFCDLVLEFFDGIPKAQSIKEKKLLNWA